MATPEQLANAAKLAEKQDEIKKQLEETLEIRKKLLSQAQLQQNLSAQEIEDLIFTRDITQEMEQLETARLAKIQAQKDAADLLRKTQTDLRDLQIEMAAAGDDSNATYQTAIFYQKQAVDAAQGAAGHNFGSTPPDR